VTPRLRLRVLLSISGLLLLSWSVAVPIFEAPDEPHHWLFARYVNQRRSLPVFNKQLIEANSPPAYYLIIAPVAFETDIPEFFVDPEGHRTPFGVRVVLGHGQPALRIYRNDRSDFGRFWPIRVARIFSVIMSVFTVLFTYLAGRESTGRSDTGLLAASLVAFLPQFTFRASQVSNDSLVATMGALSLYVLVVIGRRGFTWSRGIVAGLAIAGAYLTKINAIFLPLPLGLTLLAQEAPWRQRLIRLGGLVGLMLALVMPWTVRNVMLYGDPFAQKAMHTVVSSLVVRKPLTSPYFYTTFWYELGASFIGVFGWMNLWLPAYIYWLYALFALLAVGGLLRGWMKDTIDRRLALILASIPLLNLMIVIYINLSFSQPQGRYMFPALAAIGVLLALGMEGLPGWRRSVQLGLVGTLLATNVFILAAWLIPAYWG